MTFEDPFQLKHFLILWFYICIYTYIDIHIVYALNPVNDTYI